VAVNSIIQQFYALRDATNANREAQEEAATSFRAGDFESGVDVLRGRAAESEQVARGSALRNALLAATPPFGLLDAVGRARVGQQAGDLAERAELAAERQRRREEIDAQAAARGSASVFGLEVEGAAEIEQGIA